MGVPDDNDFELPEIDHDTLPACMMPDGAPPCGAYRWQAERIKELTEAVRTVKKVIDSGIEVRFLGNQLSFGEAVEKCRLALEKAEGADQ